jgi:hypothetical protein
MSNVGQARKVGLLEHKCPPSVEHAVEILEITF